VWHVGETGEVHEAEHLEDRHRWEDNIKTGVQEVGWGSMGWIAVAQDRETWRPIVNSVMNLGVP